MGKFVATHRYAFTSRAAALMNAAVPVAAGPSMTSLPTLYAKTLVYLLNTLMVLMYWSRRFVVHWGLVRVMEPLTGRARSILCKTF